MKAGLERLAWLALLATLGVNLTSAWADYSSVPLTDPVGYVELAQRSRFFYDSAPREPLHIFALKIALPFFDHTDTALRDISVLWTVVSLGILCVWARLTLGGVGALLAGFTLASSPLVLYYSVQGFNVATYGSFLVLFAAIWEGRGVEGRPAWGLGLLGGLCGLARLEGLAVAVLSFAFDGATGFQRKNRAVLKKTASAILIAFLMVAPYFLLQKLAHGSFIHSHRIHAMFWSNRAALAESGFDAQKTKLRESPMGLWEFFSERGTRTGVARFLKGIRLAFSWYTPRLFQGIPWAWVLVPVGVIAAIEKKRWRLLFLWLASTLPVAFILPIDQVAPGSGVELRFLLPTIPILAYLCGMGGRFILDKVRFSRDPDL